MNECVGDLWAFHDAGHTVCITTNGLVKSNGAAIMGRGIALQAVRRFAQIPKRLGADIISSGNIVYYYSDLRLFTFPTKHNWWEKSDVGLIASSAKRLTWLADAYKLLGPIYLPRAGCGEGGLQWRDVRSVLGPILDSRFTVVRAS